MYEVKETRGLYQIQDCQKQNQNELRKSIREFERLLAKEAKKNQKVFYTYVNSRTKSRTRIPTLAAGDIVGEASVEKAEVLNKYFSSIYHRNSRHIAQLQ